MIRTGNRKLTGIRFIFICALSAFLAAAAPAHPLGNFSVNQYSGIEVAADEVRIRQILDLAEIPTLQAAGEVDTDKDGVFSESELNAYAAKLSIEYVRNLRLTLGGEVLELRPVSTEARTEQGDGDLRILKIIWSLAAKLPRAASAGRIAFENGNYRDRIGWNEMVVKSAGGVSVFDSTAFGSGLSDELRAYPEGTIASPLSERSAEFSFTSGGLPAGAKPLVARDGSAAPAVERDRLAELIAVREITPEVALFGLLLAFGLGALHAMSPGHGKAVVGAYLVGSRGTPRHAAFLGLTVTVTHTIGVFALGLITLFASQYVLPERLMPLLSFVSGLLVFYIGITLFKNRAFAALGWSAADHHHHDHSHHDHGHHHGHQHHHHSHDGLTHTHDGHTHTHMPPESVSWRRLLALGISGGLLPCPSALVLMLSAISLGRVGYGLVLTVAFSFGLAATLTAVGLAFLYVGKALGGSSIGESRVVKALPVFSAFVIACIGAVICYNSIA